MRKLLLFALSSFALFVAPATSFGACGVPDLMKSLIRASATSATAPLSNASPAIDSAHSGGGFEHANITGLWNIKFVSGGQVVDQGFDAWHADGLEVLNDTPPPATGNVCLGAYIQSGARTFKLKHLSWIYDASNINVVGTATIRETVTVDRSGSSFGGSFTIDAVDLFGNPLGHAEGSVKATRIDVD